jgi:hypothetical protein
MTKSEINDMAAKQGGLTMTGSYLRPFTVNFTASIKF